MTAYFMARRDYVFVFNPMWDPPFDLRLIFCVKRQTDFGKVFMGNWKSCQNTNLTQKPKTQPKYPKLSHKT